MAKKIAAILAKADSSTFEGEASAFLKKAEQLMKDNGIDFMDLKFVDDPMGVEKEVIKVSVERWQFQLISALAYYYGACVVRHSYARKMMISISGKESARETVKLMWPYILKSLGRQASKARKQDDRFSRKGQNLVRKEIAIALMYRIFQMCDNNTAKGDEKNSLTIIDYSEQALNEAFGTIKNTRKPNIRIVTYAALEYANEIGLDKQTQYSGDLKKVGNK
jgi:hypothetical protein